MHVTVLMSTYNGERYIKQQLNSIFSQIDVEVRLIVRDDGSSDRTLEILQEYKNSGKNIIIKQGKNIKASKSFFELICNYCDDDYFALADQDDIWDNDKLNIAISKLSKLNNEKPLLYHSNLRLVNKDNRFFRNAHKCILDTNNKYSALAENRATGCTIVYNRKLAEIACKKKPDNFTMHDAWLFVVSSLFGEVYYDFEPHINYRQHENNVVGIKIKNNIFKNSLVRIKRFFDRNQQPRYNDAKIILEEFYDELSEEDIKKVKKITEYKQSIKNRLYLLFDKDIKSLNILHNIRLSVLILFGIF